MSAWNLFGCKPDVLPGPGSLSNEAAFDVAKNKNIRKSETFLDIYALAFFMSFYLHFILRIELWSLVIFSEEPASP